MSNFYDNLAKKLGGYGYAHDGLEYRYYRHRFPSEIISRCVWLYFRFALSYRDVKELMHEREVNVTYETVHEWCLKFGHLYARRLRSRSPRPGDRWHLDEVFLKINGRLQYLWRAVDQDEEVTEPCTIHYRPGIGNGAASPALFTSNA